MITAPAQWQNRAMAVAAPCTQKGSACSGSDAPTPHTGRLVRVHPENAALWLNGGRITLQLLVEGAGIADMRIPQDTVCGIQRCLWLGPSRTAYLRSFYKSQ